MQLARFGILWVLAGAAGCGGHDGASVAGSWTGTATDATGTWTLTGNCSQRDGDTTVVRCVLSATHPTLGATGADVFAHLFTEPGSSTGTLSYALGIHPPPCRINVSGDAAVSAGRIEGTYRGASDCEAEAIRDGQLTLVR
jgi:hypothetical protein